MEWYIHIDRQINNYILQIDRQIEKQDFIWLESQLLKNFVK